MIIFDASTLILLIKIDLLELFISNYKRSLVIPKKVKTKVCVDGREETPHLKNLIQEGQIEVLTAKNPRQKRKLMVDFNIDEGEAEALLLVLQKEAELIAADDRNAIRAAKLLKIDFVTAIGFLIRAAEKKLIERDEALFKLEKLRVLGGYSLPIIENAENRIKSVG
jgi:predicted nucleic acid-binding protein